MAFMAILHQLTKQRLDLKRVSRLVVLPDYQGIGIGRAFLDAVAEMYVSQGHMFEIKTSARNLIGSLRNHPSSRFSEGGGVMACSVMGFQPQGERQRHIRDERDRPDECEDRDVPLRGRGMPPFRGGGWRPNSYGFSSGDANSGRLRYKERSQCKTATFMFERANG